MHIRSILDALQRRIHRRGSGESGMSTAEYAVGTIAACGFAGVLFKIVTSSPVAGALSDLIQRALTTAF